MSLALFLACDSSPGLDSFDAPEHPARDALVTVTGQVLDEDGRPVPDALLVAAPGGYEARTDGDGAFTLDRVPPGPLRLVARAEGYARTARQLELARDRSIVLRMSAETPPAGSLLVQVLDPLGLAVQGARVSAGDQALVTDAEGLARLGGLGGQTVEVLVDHEELWPGSRLGLSVPDQGALQLSITLAGRSDEAHVVGSGYCLACHAEIVARWEGSAHAGALGPVEGELARRFEQGDQLSLGSASARLGLVGEARIVELTDSTGATRELQVEGLIGQVPWAEDEGRAWALPLAWRPASPDRPGFPDSQEALVPWRIERWLDEQGRFVQLDPSDSAEASCFPCHATGFRVEEDGEGGLEMRSGDGEGRWVEAGVGCERCHGPGSEHIAARDERKAWRITQPVDLGPERANQVCRSCHGALEAHEGGWDFALSGGEPHRPGQDLDELASSNPDLWPSGAAAAPGQQGDELLASGHGPGGLVELGCVDCHEPHGGDGAHASLRQEVTDNTLCSSCHLALTFEGDPARLEAHDGHETYDPAGPTEAGRCVGCHMPATAARLAFGAQTGDGDRSSHLFLALPPEETLASFSGETQALGSFPPHACGSCHAWNAWEDPEFSGADGEPTERSTHEAHQADFDAVFP
jgi:predicted CXXCH cytochrome family protein